MASRWASPSAALVHLAFGSPGGRPTTQQVALALASLGVEADNVRLAPLQNLGRTLMLADGPDGPLDVTVMGRDERDARWFSKSWRFLFYRDSGPTLFHSRLQEVEHEAYLLLRATREGVDVPDLVEVGQAGPDAAVLVTRTVDGTRLADLASTTPLTTRCWSGSGPRSTSSRTPGSRTATSTPSTSSCSTTARSRSSGCARRRRPRRAQRLGGRRRDAAVHHRADRRQRPCHRRRGHRARHPSSSRDERAVHPALVGAARGCATA